MPSFNYIARSIQEMRQVFASPLVGEDVASNDSCIHRLLSNCFLALIPNGRFCLTAPFFVNSNVAITLSRVGKRGVVFCILVVNCLGRVIGIFIYGPSVPKPRSNVARVLSHGSNVTLPSKEAIRFRESVTTVKVNVMFCVHGRIRHVLPSRFNLNQHASVATSM